MFISKERTPDNSIQGIKMKINIIKVKHYNRRRKMVDKLIIYYIKMNE